MGLEVNWRPHAMVSGLHAAEAVATNQPIVDERLKETITTPALDLAAEIRAADLPSAQFWRHLIPLAGTGLARRPLVETAAAKTVGRGSNWSYRDRLAAEPANGKPQFSASADRMKMGR